MPTDLAEFVSNYVQLIKDCGAADLRGKSRAEQADIIAGAYAEHVLDSDSSLGIDLEDNSQVDVAWHTIKENARPQVEYYLS